MRCLSFVVILSLYSLLCSSCNPDTKTKTLTLNAEDFSIITEVYQECLFIIKTSEETIIRGTAMQTKDLARQTINESTNLKLELAELAGKRTQKLPLDISDDQIKDWRILVTRKGWDLDKKYLEFLKKSNLKIKSLLTGIKGSEEQDVRKIATRFSDFGDSSKDLVIELRQKVEARTQVDTTDRPVTYK